MKEARVWRNRWKKERLLSKKGEDVAEQGHQNFRCKSRTHQALTVELDECGLASGLGLEVLCGHQKAQHMFSSGKLPLQSSEQISTCSEERLFVPGLRKY